MKYITVNDFFTDNKGLLGLDSLAGAEYMKEKKIVVFEINRPGLALSGFFDYFPYERIQIFGKTEFSYLKKIGREKADRVLADFFKRKICCAIVSTGLTPVYNFLKLAAKNRVPVIASSLSTTSFIGSATPYLEKKLAPRECVHGTFVEVCGVGVLLTGKSGIGKSEVSLELIKKGHRLIADDLIDIVRLNDRELAGSGMNIVKHHMEIRGVGIIDVRNMFGVGAIKEEEKLELVLHMEEWAKDKDYERLGIDDKFEEILGVRVPKIVLPVKPGRSLSAVVEVAAMTQRLKGMGYNPARELSKKVINWMERGGKSV